MKRKTFRLWVVASLIWLVAIAYRTFKNWPVDITWDNGVSSRVETLVDAAFLASLPTLGLVIAVMSIWVMRGVSE